MTKDDVLQFLDGERFCVLATASQDGTPEAAFIGFTINEDLELVIGTSTKSRKYRNLKAESHVALVFKFDGHQTLQYEGIAAELGNAPDHDRVQEHFAKFPGTKKFINDPNQTWFTIKPTWIRLVRTDPGEPEEMKDFA